MKVMFAVKNSAKPVPVDITGDERRALEKLAGIDKFGVLPHKKSAEQVVKELLERSQKFDYVKADVSVKTCFRMNWNGDHKPSSWFDNFTATYTVLIDGRAYVVEVVQFGRSWPLSVVDSHNLKQLGLLIDGFDWFKAHTHKLMDEKLIEAIAERTAGVKKVVC